MQSSSVMSSGRSARSGRSGSGVEKVEEGRKFFLSEMKKVAAEQSRAKQSREERLVEAILSACQALAVIIQPEQKKRRSSEVGVSKVVKIVFPVEESVLVDLKKVRGQKEKVVVMVEPVIYSGKKVSSKLRQKVKVTVQVPVVAALPAVPVEKVRSEALSRSEVRDLNFVWPGLGSKVRVELEGGSVDGLEGSSVVDGLEGGSVVDGLEGGIVFDGLEGGSVVDGTLKMKDTEDEGREVDGVPDPAQDQDIEGEGREVGGVPVPAQDQDTEDEGREVGGVPDPAQDQDIEGEGREVGGVRDPAQDQDTEDEGREVGGVDPEPALEPRRPSFISDEFKECLRTVFEELPGKVTSQQILGKIQENRELQTFWEEYLQVSKSKAKAVDSVKQFLGGSRKVKGHLDPAIENKLWALLTPDSDFSKKALVQRAAQDDEFKVVWDHFKARRPTLNKAADWVRRTYLRKGKF